MIAMGHARSDALAVVMNKIPSFQDASALAEGQGAACFSVVSVGAVRRSKIESNAFRYSANCPKSRPTFRECAYPVFGSQILQLPFSLIKPATCSHEEGARIARNFRNCGRRGRLRGNQQRSGKFSDPQILPLRRAAAPAPTAAPLTSSVRRVSAMETLSLRCGHHKSPVFDC